MGREEKKKAISSKYSADYFRDDNHRSHKNECMYRRWMDIRMSIVNIYYVLRYTKKTFAELSYF